MKTVFNVEGMSCSHCENSVRSAVSGINGVSDVDVCIKEKRVTVTHDDSVSTDDIRAEIEDQGFDVL